jgi:Fe2+ or Zn2+ uptake regulation protein
MLKLIKPKFIKLPSFTIRRMKNDMPNKDVLVNQNTLIPEILIRLQMQMNYDDECVFSIENLITKCGYTPQAGKGRSIDLFRQALQTIQEHGFIYNISFAEGTTFANVRATTLLTCNYDEKIEVNEKDEAINYYTININDYILMSKSASGSNLRNLINVYCYLSAKKLMTISSSTYTTDGTIEKVSIKPDVKDLGYLKKLPGKDVEYFNNGDFYKFGYAFATYDTICAEISEDSKKVLAKATLSNVLKQLADLGIIYYGNVHDYIDIDTIKKPCNIYAFTIHGFYTGLKISFNKQNRINDKLYSTAVYKQFLENVFASLKQGEHHHVSKGVMQDD